jgi:hypothetical protein
MSFQQSAFEQDAFQIGLQAAAGAVGDDDDGWWSGVQAFALGAARGLAIAALGVNVAIAGSFNQQDERPTPAAATPATADAQASFTQRATAVTSFQRWWAQDEIVTRLDEEYWAPPFTLQPKPITLGQVEDDFVPQGAPPPFALEDDAWLPPQPAEAALRIALAAENDELVTPVQALRVDEEPWLRLEVPAVPPVLRLWQEEDARPLLVPQEEEGAQLLRSQDAVRATLWNEDDHIVPPPAAFRPDDEYWLQLKSLPPEQFARVFIEQDERVKGIAVEEYWQPFTPPLVAPQLRVWIHQDERESPVVPLVEFDFWPQPYLEQHPDKLYNHLFVDEDHIAPQLVPPPPFTTDGTTRIGYRNERDFPERIGNRLELDEAERIGQPIGLNSPARIR